jgi:hypothetical protein
LMFRFRSTWARAGAQRNSTRPPSVSDTERLGRTSGEKWLTMIGDDTDFAPKERWAKNTSGRGEKLQSELKKASVLPFSVPDGAMGGMALVSGCANSHSWRAEAYQTAMSNSLPIC